MAVQSKLDLPLAARDRPWDADAAVRRMRQRAGGPNKEDMDWGEYFKGFMWRDEEEPENFGSYKLPYCDVIGGSLTVVPRAVFAIAALLSGGRGGVDVPRNELPALRSLVSKWYEEMAKEFDDETIRAPFAAAERKDVAMTSDDAKRVKGIWKFQAEESYGNLQEIVKAALLKRFANDPGREYLWISDMYLDSVVFEMNGRLFRQAFRVSDDGTTVELVGYPEEVRRKVEYVSLRVEASEVVRCAKTTSDVDVKTPRRPGVVVRRDGVIVVRSSGKQVGEVG